MHERADVHETHSRKHDIAQPYAHYARVGSPIRPRGGMGDDASQQAGPGPRSRAIADALAMPEMQTNHYVTTTVTSTERESSLANTITRGRARGRPRGKRRHASIGGREEHRDLLSTIGDDVDQSSTRGRVRGRPRSYRARGAPGRQVVAPQHVASPRRTRGHSREECELGTSHGFGGTSSASRLAGRTRRRAGRGRQITRGGRGNGGRRNGDDGHDSEPNGDDEGPVDYEGANGDVPGYESDDSQDPNAQNFVDYDDPDGAEFDPQLFPGHPQWVKPKQPPPHAEYVNHGERVRCNTVAIDREEEPILDMHGMPILCTALLWTSERVGGSPCCNNGKSVISPVPMPPDNDFMMLYDARRVGQAGFDCNRDARTLNMKFTYSAMGTSCGVNQRGWHVHGHAPYSFFKLHGLTYHNLAFDRPHLLPWRNWTHVPEQERPNREGMNYASYVVDNMMRNHNVLHPQFQLLRERMLNEPNMPTMTLVFRGHVGTQHGAPAVQEMANLATGPHGLHPHGYHAIVVKRRPNGTWQNTKLWAHKPGFMECQYPMLFPMGTGGWMDVKVPVHQRLPNGNLALDMVGQPIVESYGKERFEDVQGNFVSLHEYVKKRMYTEENWHKTGKLYQQYTLDMYATDVGRKLWFEKQRQSKQRLVSRQGVATAANAAVLEQPLDQQVPAIDVGKPFLSSNFTGSPAYYAQNKRKALAVLARCGRPSYFITMTCNPNWPEIKAALLPGQQWRDRHDLVDRVFQLKKEDMMDHLRRGIFFNDANANRQPFTCNLWVTEYQKRGLPHVHIAVRVKGEQPNNAATLDRHVSANLPEDDEWLNQMVQSTMIHKCTPACQRATPTRGLGVHQDSCKYFYPKPVQALTTLDEKGFVLYKRNAKSVWVVPSVAAMLRRYHCHINVEVAASVSIIAYLFKYVFKGSDSATVAMRTVAPQGNAPVPPTIGAVTPPTPDACDEFLTTRFTGSTEAAMHFFGFHRCRMTPSVDELPVHLPGHDNIIVDEANEDVRDVVNHTKSQIAIYFLRPKNRTRLVTNPIPPTNYFTNLKPALAHHQVRVANQEAERAVLDEYLPPNQIDAVMMNDFDSMTYTTFWEHYIVTPTMRTSGWFLQEVGPPYKKIKRRELMRRNNVKICYIRTVLPTKPELFYMRLLLKERPARNFEDLRMMDGGGYYATFEECAKQRGLVVDDNEAELCMQEVVATETPNCLRRLFVTLITQLPNTQPYKLFVKFHEAMQHDYHNTIHPEHPFRNEALLDPENRTPRVGHYDTAYNRLLLDLDKSLGLTTSSNVEVGLPAPEPHPTGRDEIREHLTEFCTGRALHAAQELLNVRLPKMNVEQLEIYWDIIKRLRLALMERNGNVELQHRQAWTAMLQGGEPPNNAPPQGTSNLIFLNAKGGRGKTYLLNAIIAAARVQKLVALPACFTGFAAQDYPGGMTLHKLAHLPVDTDNNGTDPSNILASTMSKESARAKLLREAIIIVIDEVPSAGNHILVAVDNLLRDLCLTPNDQPNPRPFAGKIVILSGDFQQTSPIVKGDRAANATAWLTMASFWRYDANEAVNYKTLNASMRQQDDPEFDDYIQSIGAGAATRDIAADQRLFNNAFVTFATLGRAKHAIKLPTTMFRPIHDVDTAIATTHPDLTNARACADAGVLCTKNATVDDINARALALMVESNPQYPVRILHATTLIKDYRDAEILDGGQPNDDFLQMCSKSGVPPHKLELAVGAVCMLVRNIAPGLTNGKRLVVKRMNNHSVEVVSPERWHGPNAQYAHGDVHFIPRIIFQWRFSGLGMTVERRQFPLRLAYAVTFNKSQGKTLSKAVIDLRDPPFAHGQLYVALSRIPKALDLAILCDPESVKREANEVWISTINVVERVLLEQSVPPELLAAFRATYPIQ